MSPSPCIKRHTKDIRIKGMGTAADVLCSLINIDVDARHEIREKVCCCGTADAAANDRDAR